MHPEYVRTGEPWIDPRVSGTSPPSPPTTASRAPAYAPRACRWQEPDGGFATVGDGAGRTDLHASIDTEGRTTDRRADFDTVYGDWAELAERDSPRPNGQPADTRTRVRHGSDYPASPPPCAPPRTTRAT